MIKNIKERIIGASGSVSGVASILGSWQVCHNICLAIVAILSIIGITVVGMPLLFLTKLAVPFWTAAFILLLITYGLYIKKKCISKKLIIFNSGLIIAGMPFKQVQTFSPALRAAGGILVSISIYLFIKDKIKTRNRRKK